MTSPESVTPSPPWGGNVKLIVGLTFVAIIAAFLMRFHNIIVPLLMAVMLTYLLHPLAGWVSERTKLSWRSSVNIIFLVMVVLLVTAFTLTGVEVVQQLQRLIGVVERFIEDVPDLVTEWSTQVYYFGPYQLNMSQYLSQEGLEALIQEILSVIQPVLGQAGGLLSTVASRTLSILGWGFFIVLVSYFILADMGRVPERLIKFDIPGYDEDIQRLGREFSRIWNAFFRGQVILFTLTVFAYTVLLGALGMRYVLGLALLAGLARFVPYIGPWVTWIVTTLVALFHTGNYFGLDPVYYAILVVVLAIVVDQIFDNLISPRFLGQTLGVHPAAVLIAAIIAANLLGLVGVVLAAPVLASVTLIGLYTTRKMLDLNPWPEPEGEFKMVEYPWAKWTRRVHTIIGIFRQRRKKKKS